MLDTLLDKYSRILATLLSLLSLISLLSLTFFYYIHPSKICNIYGFYETATLINSVCLKATDCVLKPTSLGCGRVLRGTV
jgi:hypothetical protein